MSQKLKVVTIGGGSSYTPELLEGFIKRYHELPVSELWLVDVEDGKEKLDIIFELCQRMIDNAGVPMKLYKTLDRREALKDADFTAMLTDVLAVKLSHQVGQLQVLLSEICKAGINIEYMYAFANGSDASAVLKSDAPEKVVSVLKGNGFDVWEADEAYHANV